MQVGHVYPDLVQSVLGAVVGRGAVVDEQLVEADGLPDLQGVGVVQGEGHVDAAQFGDDEEAFGEGDDGPPAVQELGELVGGDADAEQVAAGPGVLQQVQLGGVEEVEGAGGEPHAPVGETVTGMTGMTGADGTGGGQAGRLVVRHRRSAGFGRAPARAPAG